MATTAQSRKSEVEKVTQAEIRETREVQRKLQKQRELGIRHPEAEERLEEHITEVEQIGKEAIKEIERTKPKPRPQAGISIPAMPGWWPDYIAANPDAYPSMPAGTTPQSVWRSLKMADPYGRKHKDIMDKATKLGFLVEVGETGSEDYTLADYYNSLDPELQSLMDKVGTGQFQEAGVEKGLLTEVGPDKDAVPTKYYDNLSDEAKKILKTGGIEALNKHFEGIAETLSEYEGVSIEQILSGTESIQPGSELFKALAEMGYSPSELQAMSILVQSGEGLGHEAWLSPEALEKLSENAQTALEAYRGYNIVGIMELLEHGQSPAHPGGLTPTQQQQYTQALLFLGVDPENLQEASQFVQSTTRLETGEWVNTEFYDALPSPMQQQLTSIGKVEFTEKYKDLADQLATEGADVEALVSEALGYGDDPNKRQREDISQAIIVLDTMRQEYSLTTEEANALLKEAEASEGWTAADRRELTDAIQEAQRGNHEALDKILKDAKWYEAKEETPDNLDNAMLIAVAQLYELAPAAYPQYKDASVFVANNVLLDAGDWVGKDVFLTMPKEDQARLNDLGIEGYQEWIEKNYIKLSSGEYIGKTDFEEMPEDYQEKLTQLGSIAKFDAWYKDNHIKIGDEYISKEIWEALSPEEQNTMKQLGISGYQDWFKTHHVEIGNGDWMVKTEFEALPKRMRDNLMKHGYRCMDSTHLLNEEGKWIKTTGLTPQLEYDKLKKMGMFYSKSMLLGRDDKGQLQYISLADLGKAAEGEDVGEEIKLTPAQQAEFQELIKTGSNPLLNDLFRELNKLEGQTVLPEKLAGIIPAITITATTTKLAATRTAIIAAEMIVPGVFTVKNWNNLSPWEKGAYIAMDLLIVIPMIRWAAAMARTASIAGKAGRVARIAKVAKATPIALMQGTVDVVRHPIRTAGMLSDPAEIALRYHRMPIESLVTGWTTMKIRIAELGGKISASEARAMIMSKAVRGEPLVAQIRDASGKVVREVKLSQNLLSQATHGAVFHATPNIRPYLYGTTVGIGDTGALYFAPNFAERFAMATASAAKLPKGAIRGGLIITDKKLLKALRTTTELGGRRVEIEAVLKQGIKLPPPSQTLIARGTDGKKLMLLIIGPKLSPADIAKIKLLAPKAVLKQIFGMEWKVTKASRLMDKVIVLEQKILRLKDRLKVAPTEEKTALRQQIATHTEEAKLLARRVDEAVLAASPPAPPNIGAIVRGGKEFYDMVYEEWAKAHPADFANYLRSRPRTESRAIVRALPTRVRQRIQRLAGLTRVQLRAAVRSEAAARAQRVTTLRRASVARSPRVPSVSRVQALPRLSRVSRIPRVPRVPRVPSTPRVPTTPRILSPPRTPVPPQVPPPVPPVPRDKEEKDRKLTEEEKKAAVGWRQGLYYCYIAPPYKEIIWEKEPIPGVKITKGIKSAYESVSKLKGKDAKLPPLIKLDMGIMDVHVTTPQKGVNKGKPKLHFKRDIKQETTLSGVR